jgi:hypothetical protein
MSAQSDYPIRLFIGSSPKNSIEEKVFRYTLQKYSNSPIEINIIDGQAGTVTTLGTGEVKTLPMDVIGRIKGATYFSLARWAIPQWCGYQGKAIYCDSDQLAFADLSGLWNSPMEDATLAAVPAKKAKSGKHFIKSFLKRYINTDETYYLASVMLMDCEKSAVWSLESLVDLIDRHEFSLSDLMYVGAKFRSYFNLSVAELSSDWNHLDYTDAHSKIVHFSDLTSQPWIFHHHPISDLWEQYFLEAVDSGFLSQEEVLKARSENWITERIKALALMPKSIRRPVNWIWRSWSAVVFLITRFIANQIRRVRSIPSKLSAGFNLMKGARA